MISPTAPKANVPDIKTLFFPGAPRWSSNTVTYNFMPFISGIYTVTGAVVDIFLDSEGIPDPVSFRSFDAKQQVAAQEALNLWAEVTDIRFVQKSDAVVNLDLKGVEQFLDLGIIKQFLDAAGKLGDFFERYVRFVNELIGAPLVNGADIRFGTANITGAGGAVPPYGDTLTSEW
ncbi:hypothetical protein [Leptolyngbya ohadii]|uniref:hypothetical protein n=1 Tax=Leptolyngbya ohadii TaxID=1962290 RepID=UPI00117BBCA4|nr:hypothetical protein [Leptolyngbya ohadii]